MLGARPSGNDQKFQSFTSSYSPPESRARRVSFTGLSVMGAWNSTLPRASYSAVRHILNLGGAPLVDSSIVIREIQLNVPLERGPLP